MAAIPHPTAVELHRANGLLTMTWSDGLQTDYALAYLRGWCPCASCQGHFSTSKTFIQADATLMDVKPVGTYGMSLHWLDGHSSGIYSFVYLREIFEAAPGDGPSNRELLLNA